jgi:amylosucrase
MPPTTPAAGSDPLRAGLLAAAEAKATAALDPRDAHDLLARIDTRLDDALEALERVYPAHDLAELVDSLLALVIRASAERPEDLRRLDRRREIDPTWYLSERMVGYVAYADRFAGSIAGVAEHLDHLTDLGVTYLHLLPLLATRPEPNDGGYAVTDFRAVDPRLGTVDDLRDLATTLRDRGISLCVDLVVNHTAREHPWARAAMAGDERYRDYYLSFDDRTLPDRYEETLWDVFPTLAPGSFTWVDELDAWVWTTFHDYQWDLDHANPAVFAEMLDVILYLANLGVEVLRLDAVPFLWKRLGTLCQNLPEAHAILQAWRALASMAAPATIFKAEAIVAPGELVQYLGAHGAPGGPHAQRPECHLAYHNQLMVMSWSALAQRDVRLMTESLTRMRTPPAGTSWVTYVRCHDDIGWAVDDAAAAAQGLDGAAHRRFLADYYAGDFPTSPARGARFGVNEATGDARSSGTAAALAGISRALANGAEPSALDGPRSAMRPIDRELDLAVRRLVWLHAIAYGYGGIPLVWMGDELALGNTRDWQDDPARADDNRWMHRPVMDWERAARRHEPGTLEHTVHGHLARLGAVRAALGVLGAEGGTYPLWTDNPKVFAWVRDHPRHGRLVGLANAGDGAETVDAALVWHEGLATPYDALADEPLTPTSGRLRLDGLQVRWVVDRDRVGHPA